jgi:hypothetical protein
VPADRTLTPAQRSARARLADHPELGEGARRRLAISKRNEHMARLAYNRERARARRQGAVA